MGKAIWIFCFLCVTVPTVYKYVGYAEQAHAVYQAHPETVASIAQILFGAIKWVFGFFVFLLREAFSLAVAAASFFLSVVWKAISFAPGLIWMLLKLLAFLLFNKIMAAVAVVAIILSPPLFDLHENPLLLSGLALGAAILGFYAGGVAAAGWAIYGAFAGACAGFCAGIALLGALEA